MNFRSLTTGVPTKSHFSFIWWNSKLFLDQRAKFLMAYKEFLHEHIRPPPYLLQSDLKILKPYIWNCLFGKVSSSLDLDIRNILKFSINSANISYLFLKELILRIKVTYYYSAWITQTLSFDVSEVISWLFKLIWEV